MSEYPPDSEFELIRRYFAPLSVSEEGAYQLKDDAASLSISADKELIVTKDLMIAGVHFISDDSGRTIAQKLLRTNLSDLAAMGAAPRAYALGVALTSNLRTNWLSEFADGLANDQSEYGITLIGGDTIFSSGPLFLSLTAFGEVPKGCAIRRSGAQIGDLVYVTGTVGDSAIGLMAAMGELTKLPDWAKKYLIGRYQIPEPRVKLGKLLVGLASATTDVSDGLIADLGHICSSSNVGAHIDLKDIPLSSAARNACALDSKLIAKVLTGGDDYELLICVPPSVSTKLLNKAESVDVKLSKIGKIVDGSDVSVFSEDKTQLKFEQQGYQHF